MRGASRLAHGARGESGSPRVWRASQQAAGAQAGVTLGGAIWVYRSWKLKPARRRKGPAAGSSLSETSIVFRLESVHRGACLGCAPPRLTESWWCLAVAWMRVRGSETEWMCASYDHYPSLSAACLPGTGCTRPRWLRVSRRVMRSRVVTGVANVVEDTHMAGPPTASSSLEGPLRRALGRAAGRGEAWAEDGEAAGGVRSAVIP